MRTRQGAALIQLHPDEHATPLHTWLKARIVMWLAIPPEVADTGRLVPLVYYLATSSNRRPAFLAGLRAQSSYDRALALREDGRPLEALALARDGLEILRSPVVCRTEPVERILLLSLTRLAEELSQQVGEPGASLEDLRDSLDHLKRLAAAQELFPDLKQRRPAIVDELISIWLPYLEACVGSLTRKDKA